MLLAILEDDERRQDAMKRLVAEAFPRSEIALFDNASNMIGWLNEHLADVDLLSLDHDLVLAPERPGGRSDSGTGQDVVDYLVTRTPSQPVVVHTSNWGAVAGMVAPLEQAGWRVWRVIPFADLKWLQTAWLPTLQEILAQRRGA
ncbi:MAG TPA: cyclic-phosphate processing receiver domain-containing protein [Blastocatellia bacterium]|nr:cyclic-phosphate processing receiver domain-containing protein [Blastocatellia bacterium]